ncbi:flagellar cap protein FliD N-terminal domain-containing protein [Chitinimonas sp.]|uniref:flagellar cap protein FliD N-terminal domain-containing protein n=1 Tax=Chitinimonas sp. TaxID=1934313 RepID=UPI0035AF9CAA
MSMSLLDAIASYHLTSRGLPAPAVKSEAGVPQPDANYSGGVSASTLTSLSGLGQALSATSSLKDQLANTSADQPSTTTATINSANTAAVTATITDGSQAAAGTYNVNVTQLAQSQVQTSIYFASDSTDYFGSGSLQVQTSQGLYNVSASSGSLTGLADAFNASGSGISATVESTSGSGYRLRLTGNQTGTNNTFAVVAPTGDPFNTLASHFSQIGLATSQTAGNAAYTVNGGSTISSQSNTAIQLTNGANIDLVATGSSAVTITSSTSATSSYSNVLATANTLVSQYNAFQSTLNQLLGSSGSLNGNIVATTLQNDFNTLVSTPAAQALGFGASATPNLIQLNASTLSSAYGSNASNTITNLNSLVDSLKTLSQSTLSATGAGSIQDAANTITTSVRNNISTALSGTTGVPSWVTDLLTNHAVTSVSGTVPFSGFSVYA